MSYTSKYSILVTPESYNGYASRNHAGTRTGVGTVSISGWPIVKGTVGSGTVYCVTIGY